MTATAPGDGSSPRPLPVRPRPLTGKTPAPISAGWHARTICAPPTCAATSPKDGTIRIELLAAMAGRSPATLEHALADLGRQQGTLPHRGPRASPDRIAARAALFTAIRRDAAEHSLSHRALADR